jgi:predicted RNase H-like HicB family nuclease
VASVPQLPGCHTDATSLDELMAEVREAIELCLEVEGQEPSKLEFVGIQRVTVAALARSRVQRERNLFGPWNEQVLLPSIRGEATASAACGWPCNGRPSSHSHLGLGALAEDLVRLWHQAGSTECLAVTIATGDHRCRARRFGYLTALSYLTRTIESPARTMPGSPDDPRIGAGTCAHC